MNDKRIAIIDENHEFVEGLEQILTISGYVPIAVKDACLAVEALIQNDPDVILLELKMPRKNGFELADEINRVFETKRIPIIAMSESFKSEFNSLFSLCGITRFLKKPFNPLDVIWAIESLAEPRVRWDAELSCANEAL